MRKLAEIYGLFIFPSDDHIGEYLAFAHEFTGLRWHYGRESRPVPKEPVETEDWRDAYLAGKRPVDDDLVRPGGELAVEIIADVLGDTGRWEPSVNVLNSDRYVENLPTDAVVEVPAIVDAAGIHPEHVGPLPEALAALCRTQVSIQLLLVDAYRQRSKNLLLDHMLDLQQDYLPRFQ